jgi:hypothetical protein
VRRNPRCRIFRIWPSWPWCLRRPLALRVGVKSEDITGKMRVRRMAYPATLTSRRGLSRYPCGKGDGTMLFVPDAVTVAKGEQIHFQLRNRAVFSTTFFGRSLARSLRMQQRRIRQSNYLKQCVTNHSGSDRRAEYKGAPASQDASGETVDQQSLHDHIGTSGNEDRYTRSPL